MLHACRRFSPIDRSKRVWTRAMLARMFSKDVRPKAVSVNDCRRYLAWRLLGLKSIGGVNTFQYNSYCNLPKIFFEWRKIVSTYNTLERYYDFARDIRVLTVSQMPGCTSCSDCRICYVFVLYTVGQLLEVACRSRCTSNMVARCNPRCGFSSLS